MGRNWDNLSDSYRRRLEGSGISREDYESGANLSAARGHGLSRESLINEIQTYKTDLFGDRRRWNEDKSFKHIDRNAETGQKRSVSELKSILEKYESSKRESATHGEWMETLFYQLREDDLLDAGFYN